MVPSPLSVKFSVGVDAARVLVSQVEDHAGKASVAMKEHNKNAFIVMGVLREIASRRTARLEAIWLLGNNAQEVLLKDIPARL